MDPTRSDGQTAGVDLESGVVRGCRLDSGSVRTVLGALDRPRFAWVDEAEAIVAGGAATTITATGRERFERVRVRADDTFEALAVPTTLPAEARPRMYGGFAFTDTHDTDVNGPWEGFNGAEFVLPAIQLVETPDGHWLTSTATGTDAERRANQRLDEWRDRIATLSDAEPAVAPGIEAMRSNPGRDTWRRQLEEAIGRIRAGDLRKVVLAQSLTATLDGDLAVADVLTRLGEPYPDCYRFLIEPAAGGAFFGATPERLVTLDGRRVATEALAGSIGRGETDDEDRFLARELRESEKNRHEHQLVVEAIRDQLERSTRDIQTGDRTIRKLANVQHLQTPIRATLADDEHVLTLVEALHPTPAVGGLPPDDALWTIRETEAFDRGWYAAPVGWMDADGDGTFAVGIRSAVAKEQTVTMFAGAGIVADSDPDAEWDELQLKYRPILDELEP